MAKAGCDVLLTAHALCGAGQCSLAPAQSGLGSQLSANSFPERTGNGGSRGVLGDITNVTTGSIAGSKPVAKPTKPSEAAGAASLPSNSIPCTQGSHRADAILQTPRCTEDMDLDDVTDSKDPQQVAEYVQDIYSMLNREETSFLVRHSYLEAQPDINAKMRAILIDWLVEVHMKYKLKIETLFLSVNLIDRYLEKRVIPRKKLQLVGVTGMLIAAKFEEIYPPEVRDFVYITDKAYTKEEILAMEVSMLTVLNFDINCPTMAHFFERYHRINGCNEVHRYLLQYVLELCLPDSKMLKYSPSHLTAAATLLSNKLLRHQPSWPQAMIRETRQTEQMVKACAKEMCGLLDTAERSPLQAVRKKFSQPKFHSVGKMTF